MPCSSLDQHEPTRPAHPPPEDLLTADHEPEQRPALGRPHGPERHPDRHGGVGRVEHAEAVGALTERIATPPMVESYLPS